MRGYKIFAGSSSVEFAKFRDGARCHSPQLDDSRSIGLRLLLSRRAASV